MPTPTSKPSFDAQYQLLLQHLELKGSQPKTIDAYSLSLLQLLFALKPAVSIIKARPK
jgi:hypothetical protein